MYVVITGASRGIGLELARLALIRNHHVLAIARHPEQSQELMNLKSKYPQLELLQQDLLHPDASKNISKSLAKWPCVDVLINNAGIYENDLTEKAFEKTFLTNSIKPFFITLELLPALKKSSSPLSLQITSLMGSLNDNTSGGAYSYRASKSALNMLFQSLSIDESWLKVLQIHPGWVQTRMGGSEAPVTPLESAEGIWKIIDQSALTQSGKFLTYRGEALPW